MPPHETWTRRRAGTLTDPATAGSREAVTATPQATYICVPERTPVNVLWITSGLGCDGDSIAMTAATNPSLDDLLRDYRE
jgi:hypothetical protein